MHIYISDAELQKSLDTFQSLIDTASATRIYVSPVNSVLPREKEKVYEA